MILDTKALSAFVDGDEAVAAILRRQSCAAIPVVVLGEFRYGIAASRHRKAYEDWLDAHLAGFDLLPVTPQTTVAYAALRSTLKALGKPIPANDAWIAAIAVEHGLPILSRDERFDVVRQVRRVGW